MFVFDSELYQYEDYPALQYAGQRSEGRSVREYKSLFEDFRFDIEYTTIDGKSHITQHGGYYNGARTGIWASYVRVPFENRYYLYRRTHYVNNKRHGNTIMYYATGKISEIIPYVDGKMHGMRMAYNSDGTEHLQREYRDGRQEGLLLNKNERTAKVRIDGTLYRLDELGIDDPWNMTESDMMTLHILGY